MSATSARLSLCFSSLGHAYSHLFMLLYPTVVLVLEKDWAMGYGDLLALAVAGQVLFGLGALPAGWLGDRWSAAGMMVIYFIGTGASAILTGFARGPVELALGLAAIGLFASIYHPVGIAWLIRNAVDRGKALGVNGVFGSIGIGGAALVAGTMSDLVGWRAAFIVPGIIAVATGVALLACLRQGFVEAPTVDRKPEPDATPADVVRVFWVLSITMFAAGLVNQACTVALPKLFSEQMGPLATTTGQVGALVGFVFIFTALAQVLGGHLADRTALKPLYVAGYLVQIPLLALVGSSSGMPLLTVIIGAMFLHSCITPAENMLLARYTPGKWRATAYGAKFVLALGLSAAAYPLVGWLHGRSGDMTALFLLLAAVAAVGATAAMLLPGARAPQAVPAAGTAD